MLVVLGVFLNQTHLSVIEILVTCAAKKPVKFVMLATKHDYLETKRAFACQKMK